MKQSNFGSKVRENREKRKAEESNYGYLSLPKDIEVFKPREGLVKLDFLPYVVTSDNHPDKDTRREIATKGSLWYKLPFKVHSNVGPNQETVICPTTFGKPCPICEYRKKLANQGVEYDELKKLDTSKRNLYIVYPGKDDPKLEAKPYIWDVSNFLFQKLLDEELDYHEQYASFPETDETGYTLELRFEEKTFNKNKFYQTNRIDFVNRKKGIPSSVLEMVPELDKVLLMRTYSELEKLMFNLEEIEDNGDEDEDDEKPIRTPKREKPIVEDGEEKAVILNAVWSDYDDEDDDDEDEKPIRNSAKPGKETPNKNYKREEEDDDEDDEKPKKEKCPYGHKFGQDNDSFPKDCNKCKVWDDCADFE